MTISLFDLEHQLTFYGQYHSNKVNVICHVICVPLIYWTALVWSTNTGPLVDWKLPGGFTPDLAFFTTITYALYYIFLEPVAGLLYTPILLAMDLYANRFASTYASPNLIAGAIHVFCWAAQIFTHQFAEGRSPALLDNLAQALFLAPLFVFLEVLFAFGYRPQLQKRLRDKVGKAITEFRMKKAQAQRAKSN
ncbi:uncharacterized protein VTP21DRAFT_2630 [Calcarisporiella thermophila]|uniref:uncharacterized protein n=1 Tax=Calcarisporiella thermophila TaxID=911321 RepID=UPI00374246AB